MCEFEYFYGQEADLFSFIRVPKLLFTDGRFKDLTSDAKILYGLLLDRMSLSVENNWFDTKGRVYIVYTIAEINRTLGCANTKACNTLQQLMDVGLIEKDNKGQGKAQLIYVKKILSNQSGQKEKGIQNKNSENQNSEKQNSQNDSSRIPISRTLEFSKPESINTENNNTDSNNTESFHFSSNQIKIYPPGEKISRNEEKRMDENSELDEIIRTVHDNIDICNLEERYPQDSKLVGEIADLMVDVLAGKTDYYIVGGIKRPAVLVKRQFEKLEYEHIVYVLEALGRNTTEVRNTRQYLIAALSNASLTMETHYETQVNHDMAMGQI